MKFTYRNPWLMVILMLLTGGLYNLYWLFITTYELNAEGAKIPHPLWVLVPLINIYWFYRFAAGYSKVLGHSEHTFLYFLFILFLNPIAFIVFQVKMNDYSQKIGLRGDPK